MKITIYKCDLCKKESRDAKLLYAPKTGAAMSVVAVFKERFKYEDVCTDCFDHVHDQLCRAIDSLKVVDKL